MTTNEINQSDLHYFYFHIVSTFLEYLNTGELKRYKKIPDEIWMTYAKEFIPLIKSQDLKIEETKQSLFDKVMSHFDKNNLSDEGKKELLQQLSRAILALSSYHKPICNCGVPSCDWECGVQSCGVCIDCCRCYWD